MEKKNIRNGVFKTGKDFALPSYSANKKPSPLIATIRKHSFFLIDSSVIYGKRTPMMEIIFSVTFTASYYERKSYKLKI